METQQINIRLPTDLLKDVGIVSKLLKVNKSEWIKTKLAEEVHREKNKLLMELSTQYSKGLISRHDLEAQLGKKVADEMELVKKTALESVKAGIKYGKKLKNQLSA